MTQTLERDGLTFVCDDPMEVWRANTIQEKEPGTVAWIKTFDPGDVFYDVGANIGVYSLLAAQQGCTVYAIEPHIPNAAALIRNVHASGLSVVVVTSQVSNNCGLEPFYYRSIERGSSGSQSMLPMLGGKPFTPVITEVKRSIRLADLMGGHRCHVKIDVDGRECQIVDGIAFHPGLVSVQVETEPEHRDELCNMFARKGFRSVQTHYTANGQRKINEGADPRSIICNTIFRRA